MSRKLLILISVLALSLAVACGSGDDPASTVTPTPPATETPTPDPTPDASPTPEPTPDETPTPDPTPTTEPTPDPSPTVEPTPDPTPSPAPTPRIGDPSEAPEGLTGGVLTTWQVGDQTFRLWITNQAAIAAVYEIVNGDRTGLFPNGVLVEGPDPADYNDPWSWHIDPEEVELVEMSIELCDGEPSFVEEELDYWLNTVGQYCPWGAQLVEVIDLKKDTTGPTGPVEGLTGGVLAVFRVAEDYTYRAFFRNPDAITELFRWRDGERESGIPNGRLLKGPGENDFNAPWSWHQDPDDLEIVDVTIELCDGTPAFVEEELEYWLTTVRRYCPWSAELIELYDYR